VSKAKVNFVKPQRFTINLPSVGAPVAVSTEGDEIFVSVRLTLRPRHNVMDVNFDVSASRDGAPMPGFDKDAPPKRGRN